MAQQMIERRRRFVYCEFEPGVAESQQDDEYSVEPPAAKKTRGANVKYVYYGIAESLEDLMQKATEAGLFCKENKNGRAYFQCRKCPLKWKTNITTDSKWIINISEDPNEHVHANRKNGLTDEFKEVCRKRVVGQERTNAGAVLTQLRTDFPGVPKPTTEQVRNCVKYLKKTMNITGDICFADVEKMVQREISYDRSELLEFKYLINDENDPSKTDFSMIFTCKKLLDEQRSQKHSQFDATFKLLSKKFPVVIWGYSDKNRHIHPTGVAIISSESTNVYKWIFEFLKSNSFCNGEWIPEEVMADNSPAISAAAREVFPTATRRNCKVHVIRAVDKKFESLGIDKATAAEMKDQLCELERVAFLHHFDTAAAALINEWKASEDEKVVEFAEYFDRQYVRKDKFWFAANGQGVNNKKNFKKSSLLLLVQLYMMMNTLAIVQLVLFENIANMFLLLNA